jgi:diguanylate cyclase (GGDEF)-like protein
MENHKNISPLFFERRYLLHTYNRFGVTRTIILFSAIAFAFGALVIIPINLIMGGKILTGLTINLIVCTTFMPYHLSQILRLLIDMDKLRMEMYEKSIHDELTQAYNRRYFFEATKAFENTSSQVPANTSLLLLDIDDFKKINDTYGHNVGDLALKTLTEQCVTMLRSTDVFARYGGDEFICLLPQTNEEQAHEIARRVLDTFSNFSIRANDMEIIIRSSIGIATSVSEIRMDELIALADKALYKAKQQGKNRIEKL